MDVYIEPVLPKPRLLIGGHGRIAETLATLGDLLCFRVTVNDPAADPISFPQAERVIVRDFDLTQTEIDPETFVVIATQHKNDHLWLQKALTGDAAYVALIASQHRPRFVLDYLAAEGVPEPKIAKIHTPAGLDLGATTPEEIALSIMSQIVAVRRGAKIKPLELNRKSNADRVITRCEPTNSG